jgi:hypothetical protein
MILQILIQLFGCLTAYGTCCSILGLSYSPLKSHVPPKGLSILSLLHCAIPIRSKVLYTYTVKMETTGSSGTLITIYQTKHYHIQAVSNRLSHRCVNPQSHSVHHIFPSFHTPTYFRRKHVLWIIS